MIVVLVFPRTAIDSGIPILIHSIRGVARIKVSFFTDSQLANLHHQNAFRRCLAAFSRT
jgi:hypothetical protein